MCRTEMGRFPPTCGMLSGFIETKVGYQTFFIIVLVCARTIAANRDSLLGMTGMLVAIGLLMNVLGLIGGYLIAWVFRMDVPQRRSLAIEGGMQNAGLGAVLASEHFSDKAAMPAAVFVFVCIITASFLAAYWQRTGRRSAVPQAAE